MRQEDIAAHGCKIYSDSGTTKIDFTINQNCI